MVDLPEERIRLKERLRRADRQYHDFSKMDDPLAFAVLSMQTAVDKIIDGEDGAYGVLSQAIAACEYHLMHGEHDPQCICADRYYWCHDGSEAQARCPVHGDR